MSRVLTPTAENIALAVSVLREGGFVAFPTETVYGLGADASNPEAIKRIFEAKGRPADHPVIVHIAGVEQLADWAVNIPESAFQLAEAFWQGPLTLILHKAPRVPDLITGGQNTIGLRSPNHSIAKALLSEFGGGVAAPSANSFGSISPTLAEHVQNDIGDKVDIILDGGQTEVGIESTIIDLTGVEPKILRPGAITAEDILLKTGLAASYAENHTVRAPGTLKKHYSPKTPLMLTKNLDAMLKEQDSSMKVGVLAFREKHQESPNILWINIELEPVIYANKLYKTLRYFDTLALDLILIEEPPVDEKWLAIRDRLRRASA